MGHTGDDDAKTANQRHRERYLSTGWTVDGSLLIAGKLSPEDGALVQAALCMVQDRCAKEDRDIPAETPQRT